MLDIFGYGLIQTGIQLLVKPFVDELQAKRKMEEQLELLTTKQRLDIETTRINREMSFRFERQTLEIQFQNSLALRERDLADYFTKWSVTEDFKLCWPLTNTYQNSSLVSLPNSNNARSVMVFISEPDRMDRYSPFMKRVNNTLMMYFSHPLFKATSENALTSQIGAWKPGFNQPNNINNLFKGLKLQPCVVVHPVFRKDKADIYISSWGPFYEGDAPIFEKCLTIDTTGNESETEEKITCAIALLTGFYTDIYHLLETGAQPQMPIVLKDFCAENHYEYEIPQNIIDSYRVALYGITYSNCLGKKLPKTYLNLAKVLRVINSDYAIKTSEQLFREGVGVWANLKSEIKMLPQNDDNCLELIRNKVDRDDVEFIENVKEYYTDEEKIINAISKIHLTCPNIEIWTEIAVDNPIDRVYAITYGNGKFIAGGIYGKIMYSDDGKTWNKLLKELPFWIASITYGNGKFVAVGSNPNTDRGSIAFSNDGILWTIVTNIFFEKPFKTITYGNGRFVAGGWANGKMAISVDGENWINITRSFPFDIRDIICVENLFVAISHYEKLLLSSDGKTWTIIDSPLTNMTTISYGKNRFIIADEKGKIAYSTDGKVWIKIENTPFEDSGISTITYGNGIFVAGGFYGKIAYSINGIVWTEIKNIPIHIASISSISYGNGRFVSSGGIDDRGSYSTIIYSELV